MKKSKTKRGLSRHIAELIHSVAIWIHQSFLNYCLKASL